MLRKRHEYSSATTTFRTHRTDPQSGQEFLYRYDDQATEANRFLSETPIVSDVIGIVMSIHDLVHGRNKQNKEYTKRDVVIVDRTGQITVTLWYQMVLIELARQIFLSATSSPRRRRFPRQRFER
jgi:hypothetical protein